MARSTKWVYFFGNGKAEGKGTDKMLLGGKGAGLAEMTNIGLPVPGGFTLATDCCDHFFKARGKWPTGLEKQVHDNMRKLERMSKQKFGAGKHPLLVSVRSGAAVSMPGMMETILNLGLNDESVEALAARSGNRRFALDAYRRLIMMYGATARGIDRGAFDDAFDELKETQTRGRIGAAEGTRVEDTDINEAELQDLIGTFKGIYAGETGEDFPQDPYKQLKGAIDAVFESWMADKAITYRRVEKIQGVKGTAVNICQMVFGNMGDDCGTGVCFTRDPSTGENVFYGDLLMNAQGEDVVAGVRTPVKLSDLIDIMPEAYDQLDAVRAMLEVHYREMQDLEFTIERGKLYLLQCRTGKRSPAACFKIAVDQATKPVMSANAVKKLTKKKYLPARYARAAAKPIITKDEAIARIKPEDIERLFYPVIDPQTEGSELKSRHVGTGINAVPGAACGQVVFDSDRAEERAAAGEKVILVCKETSPEDVGGMYASVGILTATGGKTSHAAVVARGWGKCCIVGCDVLNVSAKNGSMAINGQTFQEGDFLTLDGGTGEIFSGQIELARPEAPPEFGILMGWCDQRRRMKVRTNADTPEDSAKAIEMGAEGIGLCRTEHMFFDPREPQRLRAMREMILADNLTARLAALEKLRPFQQGDFEGIFEVMDAKPVTIRLLDPPLHEFLPQSDNMQAIQEAADDINGPVQEELARVEGWDHLKKERLKAQLVDADYIRQRIGQLHETNPMLGHRGCRLSITYPEILRMQVRAIIDAAAACVQRGIKVLPEIMIPLSIDGKELGILVEQTHDQARERLVLTFGNSKEIEKLTELNSQIGDLKHKLSDLEEGGESSGLAELQRGFNDLTEQRKKLLAASKAPKRLPYMVGTMIETPRAALTADRIAEVSEFFSFGTNDLTQTTMGLSRDDAGRFLPDYVDQDKAAVFAADPFDSLDVDGVGQLVTMGIEKGRSLKPKLKIGICGEHGGELNSVKFCHGAGMDYVSCSPYRVPIARLAAAQATIEGGANSGRAPKKASRPAAKRTTKASKAKKSSKKSPVGKKKSKKAPAATSKRKAKKKAGRR